MKKTLLVLSFMLFTALLLPQYALEQAFPNITITAPVDLQSIPDDESDRIFVVAQSGIIHVFPNEKTAPSAKQFLNITDRVTSGGEMGLLGLAFHPDYMQNGYFYVNYTTSTPQRRTVVSRFKVSSSNPDSADKSSELQLLTFNQPYTNHNGGQLAFGPDGYLYIATGDGGSGGDPQGNSQNLSTMLGKILRIDVNNTTGSLNYAIPPTNPFANDNTGKTKEIYSYGMRNPWRMSFDPVTGWLWCADVGQSAREEIDIIVNGGNYGWKTMEGTLCYSPTTGCDTSGKILPIWEYPRTQGYSVTGGYVYRGPNQPGLVGKYIYGDYGTKHIWAITYDGSAPAVNQNVLLSSGRSLSSFGVDRYGELYICDLSGGKIWKFTPTAPVIAPTRLVVTGSSFGQIGLSWRDNAANETGYVIERKTAGGEFLPVDTTDANVTVYTDNTITDTSRYYYRVRGINASGTSGYSNTVSSSAPVPVELVSFTAAAHGSAITLTWSTASETNNRGFEIQRKQSGYHNTGWLAVGFVSGAGSTAEPQNYSFSDDLGNFTGAVYYRLKQIDYDGKSSLSNESSVLLESADKQYIIVQNYPNPFNPSTTIRFAIPVMAQVTVMITDILGSEASVFRMGELSPGGHELQWDATSFAAGIYYLRVKAASSEGVMQSETKKIVYLK